KRALTFFDRLLLGTSGLLGTLILFLWLFTDHSAAAWNFNLLWANPANLYFACVPLKFIGKRIKWCFGGLLIMILLLLAGWPVIPQDLHEGALPLVLGIGWIAWRVNRMHICSDSK